jgi:imidazolonepropionase-like amidohydrolase
MVRDEMFAALAELFRRFARNGTRYTPTLVMYKASADWRAFVPHAQTKYVARSAQEAMMKTAEQYRSLPEVVTGRLRVLGDLIRLVGMMREQGVKVMAGTDLADGRIFPGYSIHEELALLVDAGFTPVEAIAAATTVPAEFLKMADVGLIAPLSRADMVVLTANPLADIHNTTKIDSVVLKGRLLKRTQLDALLAESARLAILN